MGRTNPTFRDALRGLRERWATYRRGLRRANQDRFDRLFEYARAHADAAGYLNPAETIRPVLLSIDLEQERRLDAIDDRVSDLEARVRVDGDDPDRDDGRAGDPECDGDGTTGRESEPTAN